MPCSFHSSEPESARSSPAFVVGLDARLTALVAAALAVALEVLVTGGIHLDALADSADGLGASGRQRALEIMREPTIGAFGATALVLDLVVKIAALVADRRRPRRRPRRRRRRSRSGARLRSPWAGRSRTRGPRVAAALR